MTTSSGKRNVVAPSSNCTRYMRRSRLFTSRIIRGCSLNRLRPSWSRTGLCSLQCFPISLSVFTLVIIYLPLRFLPVIRSSTSCPHDTSKLWAQYLDVWGTLTFHLSRAVENHADQRFSELLTRFVDTRRALHYGFEKERCPNRGTFLPNSGRDNQIRIARRNREISGSSANKN